MIAGVDVGDLGPRGATAKLKADARAASTTAASASAPAGAARASRPRDAGQFIRYEVMVNRAYKLMSAAPGRRIKVPLMRTIRSGR